MMVNRLAQFGHMSADRRLAGFDTRFETMQATLAIFPRMGFARWVLSNMKAKADIEQVQNEKKPFTLRCIPYQTTPRDSGEGRRWNRFVSNAWIISALLSLLSRTYV